MKTPPASPYANESEARELLAQGKTVDAVKLLSKANGISMREAMDIVGEWRGKPFGQPAESRNESAPASAPRAAHTPGP